MYPASLVGLLLPHIAKADVKLMTEGLAAELIDTCVKVTVMIPGAVATNIMENSG
jgi:short-subunit dehydrogenase